MNDLVIGVLGGMGPDATVKFYQNLTHATNALKDQDHFHVMIDSNAKIPDRTAHIIEGAPSPLDALVKSAQRLQNAGADVICMPCITGHSFVDQVQSKIDIPFIHAIKETDSYIKVHHPSVKDIGILCTTGAKKMRIYEQSLKDLALIYPDSDIQQSKVMTAIYGRGGIKAGAVDGLPKQLLIDAAKHLIAKGAELVIAGCTEIPLALKSEDIALPYIDPMQVVIKRLMHYDKNE